MPLLVIILMLLALATIYGIAGLIFLVAWNTFLPILWHAAPHLNFWQSLAAIVLLGFLGTVFSWRRGD